MPSFSSSVTVKWGTRYTSAEKAQWPCFHKPDNNRIRRILSSIKSAIEKFVEQKE